MRTKEERAIPDVELLVTRVDRLTKSVPERSSVAEHRIAYSPPNLPAEY